MILKQTGFTLVEVMVAFVVLLVASAAMTTGLIVSTDLAGSNERYSEAIALAQARLEDLRTLRYADIESGNAESEDGRYQIRWTVEEDPQLVSDGPFEEGMKLITIQVQWDWKGKPKEYELQTIYSRVQADF